MKKLSKIRIVVLQKDIDNGERQSATRCPIALALKRRFRAPSVGVTSLSAGNELYDIPHNATEFIRQFDNSGIIKPFIFTVTKYENKRKS